MDLSPLILFQILLFIFLSHPRAVRPEVTNVCRDCGDVATEGLTEYEIVTRYPLRLFLVLLGLVRTDR